VPRNDNPQLIYHNNTRTKYESKTFITQHNVIPKRISRDKVAKPIPQDISLKQQTSFKFLDNLKSEEITNIVRRQKLVDDPLQIIRVNKIEEVINQSMERLKMQARSSWNTPTTVQLIKIKSEPAQSTVSPAQPVYGLSQSEDISDKMSELSEV
jgi:hypothetical protein